MVSAIHPTAVIDPGAQLDTSVTVGPYSLIGPNVKVGAGTTIGSHCTIEGYTSIGQNNHVHSYTSLGAAPQDKKYAGEPTRLVIGNGNTIREFCTFNAGTVNGGGVTQVGDDNLFMAYVHLAHDCHIGNHTIFANNTQLAGHVQVGDWVILGGFTVVHQFCKLGAHSFTAMNSLLFADLPPFVMCQGQPAQARSMNFEGLRRRGFSADQIQTVKSIYKVLYRDGLALDKATGLIADMAHDKPHSREVIKAMTDFLSSVSAERGIVR